MEESELILCQQLVDGMSVGDRKCLKEIFGQKWSSITKPKVFGQKFKEAVRNGGIRNITHIGIRNSGRCDEYKKE